jgi:membrane protein YdbS with pleckstrin-like domain
LLQPEDEYLCALAGIKYNPGMVADPFVVSHVRRLPLFAYLSPEQLDVVASAFQRHRYAPGERLYSRGEDSQGLYLFVSGGGRILRAGPDGIEREVGQVQPGAYVGETSLFLHERRDASVIAAQDSIVLVLPKAQFDAVLNARPDIRPLLNMPRALMDSLQQQRERGVRPDEVTLLLTRRHPWAFAGRALRGALLFALLLGLALVSTRVTLLPAPILPLGFLALAVVVPGLMGLYYFLEWRNDYFVLTNQRVVHEERFLMTGQERREQALLNNVQNVNVARRGPVAEVIGFGDVVISTAGNPQPVVLDKIPNPMHVQQLIFDQIQKNKAAQNIEDRNAIRSQIDALLTAPASAAQAPAPQFNVTPPPSVNVFRLLFPRGRTVSGDRIIYRKHWFILIRNLWRPWLFYLALAALVMVRLSGRVTFLQAIPGVAFVVLGLLWLLFNTFWLYWEYADWYDDTYILDSQSIMEIKRRPLWLNENRKQAALQQIQNVTSQIGSIWAQLLNYGDVIIQTAAEHGAMEFRAVSNPKGVAEEILQRVQRRAELQSSAGQDEQRRMVAEYLAAYHQATRNDQAQPPPPPAAWVSRQTQGIHPPSQTQPMTPVPPPPDHSPQPTMPGQIPEMPPGPDETQARSAGSDTQPIKPPKPPDIKS